MENAGAIRADRAVRNASVVALQRSLIILSGVLTATLVPRAFGPQVYGRYALVSSMAIWFSIMSEMGLAPILARFIPESLAANDRDNLQRLFDNVLAAQLTSALAAGVVFTVFTRLWLQDLDGWVLLLGGGMVAVRGTAGLLAQFLAALNEAGQAALGETTRQWLAVIVPLLGFRAAGLRGAVLGLLLAEFVVIALVVWLVRRHVRHWRPRLEPGYLRTYMAFGLTMLVSEAASTAYSASPSIVLRLVARDYAQIGYYELSAKVYTTLAVAMMQFTSAFSPLMVAFFAQGRRDAVFSWAERLLKWMAIFGSCAVFAALLLGETVIPWLVGRDYRPVAYVLIPQLVSLLGLALTTTARTMSIIHKQPRIALMGISLRLILFWLLGIVLSSRWGALGTALAQVVSGLAQALVMTWVVRRFAPYSLRPPLAAMGLAAVFLPLVAFRGAWTTNLGLFLIFALGYGVLVLRSGLVRWNEFQVAWRMVRSGGGSRLSGQPGPEQLL